MGEAKHRAHEIAMKRGEEMIEAAGLIQRQQEQITKQLIGMIAAHIGTQNWSPFVHNDDGSLTLDIGLEEATETLKSWQPALTFYQADGRHKLRIDIRTLTPELIKQTAMSFDR